MARRAAPVGAPKSDPTADEHRRRLEALRDDLTASMREVPARDKAQLAGQLRAVLNDLAALPAATKASDVDDLAAQRARRRAAAKAS